MSFDLKSFSEKHILVVGDIMLDQYIWGNVSRISPEAPVPVVRVTGKTMVIGGAANVAANLAGLGCRVTLTGIKGQDEQGKKIESICAEEGITAKLITDPDRPTTAKTRIMASKQQLFRLDEEETWQMPEPVSEVFLEQIRKTLPDSDVVILSDYGKGVLTAYDICRRIIRMCIDSETPCLVDPKGSNWERYKGATCVTPNTLEMEAICGIRLEDDTDQIATEIQKAKKRYNLEALLLTRGAKGMCIADTDEPPLFIPTKAREVFDVSGAGDTVIATFAAAIAAGFPFRKAAETANTAAGVVVGKVGTRPVTAPELNIALQKDEQEKMAGYLKTDSSKNAVNRILAWQASGNKVVFTNGCFDLLHPGHIDLLYKSKALGDRLVVGLNSDSSVKRLKGPSRPILSEDDRAAILSALACVDLVVLFEEDTPLEILRTLRPDILVKGADYRIEDVVGRELVESGGGRVCLVPLVEGYSTSKIEKKIIATSKNNSGG